MDSSVGHQETQAPPPNHCRHNHSLRHSSSVPHHHHHHHFHVSPHCPLHHHIIHLRNHSPTCPVFSSLLPQSPIPETLVESSVAFPTIPKESTMAMPNEEEAIGMEEEGEDDEPVFVMTDEWMEFFAKSEAKRRLAKKEARRKGKKKEQ